MALEEARQALDRQSADLGNLRDRSMTLVGAGGVSAGLIVGFRSEDAPLSSWSWAGIASFVLASLVAFGIAWPQRFTFAQSPRSILDYADAHNPTQDAFARRLAEAMEDQYDENEARLVVLTKGYAVAIAAFVLEIAFLLIDLRG